ncbi:MAG TPA: hypothetical protein VGP64_08840, partial [Polyangia bacterium]
MARILLVDDPPGTAQAAVEALGLARGKQQHQVDTAASAVEAEARGGQGGYDFVLLHPERLALGAPRAGTDVLRETFEVFEDGVCLVAPDGTLEVANATGARLYRGGLKEDLQAAAREAIANGATADRGLALEGRAFAVRAYPLAGRG